jgi:hypothetical protein
MTPTDQFRLLLNQGGSRDDALDALHQAGASPMDCILAIVEVENVGFAQAKRILSESPSWADYVRQNDQSLIDELEGLQDE